MVRSGRAGSPTARRYTHCDTIYYLGRYVFRVAISHSRLEAIANGQVTFRYQDNRSHEVRRVTLPGVEFLQRFLQHVLPRGCAMVHYYGLWSAAHRVDHTHTRALLTALALIATPRPSDSALTAGTSLTGIFITVVVVDRYAASSSATASMSDCVSQ